MHLRLATSYLSPTDGSVSGHLPPFRLYFVMLDKRKSELIRLSNALAKSFQPMTLPENTLLMLALGRIGYKDRELLTHEIQIKDIQPHMGGNAYREARKAADGLLHRVVHIDEDDGGTTRYQWTTLSKYIPAKSSPNGNASISIKLNPELKPFLLELRRHYSQTPQLHILSMSSVFTRRLYQVLWADAHNGRHLEIRYAILELKKMVGLAEPDGKNEKYANWKDFKKLLESAQESFLKHGTLHIASFQGDRESGRAYSHITFKIRWHQRSNNPALPSEGEMESPEVLELARQLDAVGYSLDPIAAINTHGERVIKAALEEVKDAVKRGEAGHSKVITNPGGMMTSILQDGALQKRLEREAAPAMSEDEVSLAARMIADDFAEARRAYASELRNEGRGHEAQTDESLLADHEDLIPYELTDLDLFVQEGLRLRAYPVKEHASIIALAERLHKTP